MQQRVEHVASMVTPGWLAGTLVIAALAASPALAQVSQGGKGGGLPGHGPTGTGGGSTSSTGGGALPDDQLVYHVLDRLSYGHTEQDLAAIRSLGVDNWIRWQLEPANIPEDPALLAKQALMRPAYTATADPNWDWADLYQDYLLRARYTSRQLNEVMTEFWSNHFDTGLQIPGGGKTGWYTSIKYGPSGSPAIAYYDFYAGRPIYAYWTGSSWFGMNIEVPRYQENGSYLSLAFDLVSTWPAVSYYDGRGTRQDLKFAKYNGSAWVVEQVDTTGNVGLWTSLQFDSGGRPHIAYYDVSNGDLKLASGPAPWSIQTVDAAGDVGLHASLALDASDQPRIAYHDRSSGALKYAAWNGSSWQIQTIDAGPGVGEWCSLAINPSNARPSVSYYDASNRQLKFAELQASWSSAVIDATGDVGKHSALAFDPTGRASIAYYEDAPRYDLKFAQRNGASWTVSGVDVDTTRPQIAGQWPSIAFDASGQPDIAYHNGSQFTLRRAFWNGTTWSRSTVDNPGQGNFAYTSYEAEETAALRANALGSFRSLLGISANSPAMMIFLDNYQNTASNGNENYGRELLELHTMGVDGGYDQTDVETISRAFTGWGVTPPSSRCDVQQGAFCYNHAAHDGAAKTVVGVSLPDDTAPNAANHQRQGNLMLDALARHPSTARFICRKLIEKLVADTPPDDLWGACAQTFLQSDGNIKAVLETLLFSPAFRSQSAWLNKVRTPMEYTLASVRHLEGDTDGISMWTPMLNQGMGLFRNNVPTGWAEVGTEWVSSNGLLQRWKWADILTHSFFGSTVDPFAMIRNTGIDSADGVVEYFAQKLLRGQVGALERGLLIDCVSNGSPTTFDINDPATPGRIRDTVDMMFGFAVYQKQ